VPTVNAGVRVYYYETPIVADKSDSSFTIVNPSFALVSPSGGESYFPTNEVFIHWIAENTTTLKIELSTDNGNTWSIIASNINASMGVYDWTVPNLPSTYCKVKITDELNPTVTSQSASDFTIYPYPTITIVTPNGGEQFVAGNTHAIKWVGTNLIGGVRLEYSVDAGNTWFYIENIFNQPFGGTYYWQVPFDITTHALVRASFLPMTQMYDMSDNVFSIVNPSFALVAPNNPGLSFYPSSQMEIKWIATSTNYINIFYSTDNGLNWTLIQDSVVASLGSYMWTIPNIPSSTCKIRIYDVNDNLIYDTSDNPFTIQFLPALTLLNPNGGENYVAGDVIQLKWTGSFLTGGLYLDYSVDTGATWHNITSKWGSPNGDHYNWIAPNILAKVLIKLTYIDIPSISDQSDSLFTICFNPELHIISTPSVCQPNTVDISNYFTDNVNVSGTVSYFMDSLATQSLNDPHHVANSGIYYILKKTAFGSCSDTIPVEVVIGTTPSAPVVLPSYNICSADTGSYIVATGQNIHWYADNLLTHLIGTGNSINASQFFSDTIIYITQYSSPACPSFPATTSIYYHLTPAPPSITQPPAYCAGDSINDLIVNGSNINWFSDSLLTDLVHQGNILSLDPLYNDTVFYVTQTENNCSSSVSLISLNINPIPPKPTISQVGLAIVSSSPVGNEWFNNLHIFQDTNQYFTPTTDGFYYVVATINGCASDTSDIIYYYITGNQIIESKDKEIFIYPNPFDEHFIIYHLSDKDVTFELQVFNVTGQIFLEKNISFDKLKKEQIIEFVDLSKGLYFIRLKNNEEVFFQKIIKH